MQRKSGKFVCQCPLGLKLLRGNGHKNKKSRRFQCPLGLIPHFYQTARVTGTLSKAEVSMPSRAYTSFLRLRRCHRHSVRTGVSMPSRAYTSFLQWVTLDRKYEVLMFQCPLGLIPHFYSYVLEETRLSENNVSMPSRAYTSFLQYPFKNLGFMRFPEPVFAGIYQNILTTAVFRAC